MFFNCLLVLCCWANHAGAFDRKKRDDGGGDIEMAPPPPTPTPVVEEKSNARTPPGKTKPKRKHCYKMPVQINSHTSNDGDDVCAHL